MIGPETKVKTRNQSQNYCDFYDFEDASSIIMPEIFPTVASVILNGTLLWVTGGPIRYNSTTFFSLDKPTPTKGTEIPIKIRASLCNMEFSCHSMVQVDPKTLYIIGGDDTGNNTWIVDPTNNFSTKIGPRLRNIRNTHLCSKMKINGKWFLVVAGVLIKESRLPEPNGVYLYESVECIETVELLDTSSPNQHFTEGTQI